MDGRIAQKASDGTATLIARLVAADGSAAHRWPIRLAAGRTARRDLADAIHALCTLHGHHPGIAGNARGRAVQPEARGWLGQVADAFADERATLAAIVAAAGPLPSTPGHAATETAILAQRHALEMLARSDRRGCAGGAIGALVLDWVAIRRVIDRAAAAFGLAPASSALPSTATTLGALDLLGASPACERAAGFGAQQLLAQHRGLWSLLEARAEARR